MICLQVQLPQLDSELRIEAIPDTLQYIEPGT